MLDNEQCLCVDIVKVDPSLVQKISKRHFLRDIEKSKILIILGPFLTIENFCLITEINTAPAGSSLQGYYETGL